MAEEHWETMINLYDFGGRRGGGEGRVTFTGARRRRRRAELQACEEGYCYLSIYSSGQILVSKYIQQRNWAANHGLPEKSVKVSHPPVSPKVS